MEISRNNSNVSGQGQLTGAQAKNGEQAFHDMAKSKTDIEDIKQSRSERTKLSRTGRKGKIKTSLSILGDDEDEAEGPVYKTVMVDGMLFTLRLLAIA